MTKAAQTAASSRHAFRRLIPFLVWLGLVLGAASIPAACFTDPMFQGQDPAVVFQDGYFNLPQSDGCNIHLRRATTLGGLATASNPIIFAAGCSNVWAPEIHWISNSWWLYYSVDTGANGNERVHVAQSAGSSPSGPYTERGVLITSYWNIDGSVFSSTNGQLYFVFSGSPSGTQCIYIAPMSNPYTLASAPVQISIPDQTWERNGIVNEGPFGFVRSNQVFIVYSASGCWTDDYCLGLLKLTGSNPLSASSWTKSGPMFTKQAGAYGPGHNSVVQDALGQWWNVYHANNNPGEGCGGLRQVRAQRLTWGANNMPSFGSPVPIGSYITDDPNFLAAQFPLTETSGTSADTTGCGPAGVLRGAPVWMNPGLKFNGTNDWVDCGTVLGNDVQDALTLAAWIRADSFVNWAGIVTKGTNTSPYAMQVWGDGSLRFSGNWGSPPGYVGSGFWNSITKMTTNQWYHVAVTYDGATVRFYINGQRDPYQITMPFRFGVVNEPLVIGADFPGGDEFFSGTIRDVRVYGRALSQAEINSVAGYTHAPVFAPVGTQTIIAGQTLSVTNQATDADAPPQLLTFSLLNAPAGASVNATNGLFTWRPQIAQVASNYPVAVKVADNGTPVLSATQNFLVNVLRPASPTFGFGTVTGGIFSGTVGGDPGPDYSIYAASNLSPATWSWLLTTNPLTLPFQFVDPTATNDGQRFYRIQLGP